MSEDQFVTYSEVRYQNLLHYVRRGSRGGGQGGLRPCPPPIFWGKNKGAKNHTHRKKNDTG